MAIPNTFTNGTTADATEVNANFDYVESEIAYVKSLYQNGSFAALGSGASVQDVGSIVIPAGSINNPFHLNLFFNMTHNNKDGLTIEVSGLAGNANVSVGSANQGAGNPGLTDNTNSFTEIIGGSPFRGYMRAYSYLEEGDGNYFTPGKISAINLSNVYSDGTDPIVLKLSATASAALTLHSYMLSIFN